MKVVLQRVQNVSLSIDSRVHAEIGQGLLLLLGITAEDGEDDIDWLVKKVTQMRIFNDENGVMNKSVIDIQGEIMVVSQFTLYASIKKGNRPSYIQAARPEVAIPLYEQFVKKIQLSNLSVKTGIFGADMKINLLNDGPVTIVLDTKNKV